MPRSLSGNVLQCVRHRCNFIEKPVSLKDRFNQSSFVVYDNIESLLPKTIKGGDTSDESEYIKRIYNDEINITQFEIETDILRVMFYEKKMQRAERSFSTARRIKFCMRSKMISVKFSAFSILRTHKTLTDNLNLKDIANSFCKKSKRRRLIFGRF